MWHLVRLGIALIGFLGATMASAIETPQHTVVETHSDFELRRYAPQIVAEVEVESTFENASGLAFRVLADYIFGNNLSQKKMSMTAPVQQQASEKIAMTAPVAQQPTAEVTGEPSTNGKQRYRVNFFMPAEYTMETLPKPNNQAVTLRQIPERLMAVRRYRGGWSQERYRAEERSLLEALRAAGLTTKGTPIFNRYNSPFSLPLMRVNEVAIEVEPKA
ncbi:heme-binding protein [Microbulbifer agarilyticus]|uniref:SOUL family heme-binding protein n=1 Tax=Microbulbifer agarilyticus TaxID=260552 RepID=UPI001C956DC2|nr:heme-binding protein [Microbulbifer agarilyticus]MBY6189558.1 heme-binding protein [Microbulbifer agarilyticus]